MGFFNGSIDFLVGYVIVSITNNNNNNKNNNNNSRNNYKKNISYNSKKNTIVIVVIMVLETTTAPQLNNILQSLERCELAIGVGQRAADFRIVGQTSAHKCNCVKARLAQS
jgi:23S rRNA pseudoU1915 N3-methylase RlmH